MILLPLHLHLYPVWQVEVVEGAATGTLARLTTATTAAKKPSLTKANSTSDRWARGQSPGKQDRSFLLCGLTAGLLRKLTNLLSTDYNSASQQIAESLHIQIFTL